MDLKTILVGEDDPRDLELMLAALARTNLANHVVSVVDGVEALDYLYRRGKYSDRAPQDPAVVFLDLKMPRKTGLEVLEEIRSDPRLKTIPVVIVTSSREDRDLARGYELGANAYVVKPVEFTTFMETIAQLGLFWGVINESPPQKGDAHG